MSMSYTGRAMFLAEMNQRHEIIMVHAISSARDMETATQPVACGLRV